MGIDLEPWCTEVNTHERKVAEQIRDILELRCPKKIKARKPHVTEETLGMVRWKNRIRRLVCSEVKQK